MECEEVSEAEEILGEIPVAEPAVSAKILAEAAGSSAAASSEAAGSAGSGQPPRGVEVPFLFLETLLN